MSFTHAHQAAMAQQRNRGRCLHHDNGARCDAIISAHSIQKGGQLNLIAEQGHVYRLTADLTTLRSTGGKVQLKKAGINKVSTFRGMCKDHDNKLFAPIDDSPLKFDHEQIALYAYRSICREYFVKENAARSLEAMINHPDVPQASRQLLLDSTQGQNSGFQHLQRHKLIYDAALSEQSFADFRFLVFWSSSPCAIQASGLLFPDYDFLGRQLQDLGPETEALDLLTFFTAPTDHGWAYVLAWHQSSDQTCQWVRDSLQEGICQGRKLEDMLLRLSLACENHAIRISWWDKLTPSAQHAGLTALSVGTDPNVGIPSDYLASGCEGLADWIFDSVQDGAGN
ncbi:hypothetical protein [Pseudomonas sp. EA_15y_Pfl2_R67]|uniref:hypothetical protein n=1 Tax=Pseudomonas sp. EA_15y_Pfl2_R67 TaxID=3088687 RepID=UPI0030D85EE1